MLKKGRKKVAFEPEFGGVEARDVPAVDEGVVGGHDVAVDVVAHLDGTQHALVRVLGVYGQEGEGAILGELVLAREDVDRLAGIAAVQDVAELLAVHDLEHGDHVVAHRAHGHD